MKNGLEAKITKLFDTYPISVAVALWLILYLLIWVAAFVSSTTEHGAIASGLAGTLFCGIGLAVTIKMVK